MPPSWTERKTEIAATEAARLKALRFTSEENLVEVGALLVKLCRSEPEARSVMDAVVIECCDECPSPVVFQGIARRVLAELRRAEEHPKDCPHCQGSGFVNRAIDENYSGVAPCVTAPPEAASAETSGA